MTIKLNTSLLMELGLSRADIVALRTMVTRSGVSDSAVTPGANAAQIAQNQTGNTAAVSALNVVIDALRGEQENVQSRDPMTRELAGAVDELRNDLAAARSQVEQFRNRIESIEGRLA